MKEKLVVLSFLLFLSITSAQESKAFKSGEWLRFKMSYSGFLKAGETELTLNEEMLNGKRVLHATGIGTTSSVISWFFKVNDDYQSYFDIETGQPYVFKRKINEGGFKQHKILTFNHVKKEVKVENILKKKEKKYPSVANVQDMISAFYYLRNYDTKNMKPGEEINLKMFFDEKIYPFKLKFLKHETLETDFGKVETQKFIPLVEAGRVFKAKESVAIWITADDNKIPIKLKADLAVGSLRADLDAYKGLANPFEINFNEK